MTRLLRLGESLQFTHRDLAFSLGHHPVYPLGLGSGHGTVRGGVLRAAGDPLYYEHLRLRDGRTTSITRWRHGDRTAFPTLWKSPPTYDALTVYLGPAHRHFGHFVLESLSRLWMSRIAEDRFGGERASYLVLAELENADQRGVFDFSHLLPWQKQVYAALGINATNTLVVTNPAHFSRLVVPEQGYLYGGNYKSAALDIILNYDVPDYIRKAAVEGFDKVFLTRGIKYRKNGYIAGTRYLEDFFAHNGYDIVENEAISIDRQISWSRKARLVMAIQSSSVHVFNIFGRPDVRIAILQRLSSLGSSYMVGSLKGLISLFGVLGFSGSIPSKSSAQMRDSMFIFDDPEVLLKFFKQFDPEIDLSLFDDQEYRRVMKEDVDAFESA